MTQVQVRSARARPSGPAVGEARLTREQRVVRGRSARSETPRSSHAEFAPGPHRPDPIRQLESQGATRVPELLPIRYGRMAVSPFTFFRGAALVMASDLATTPSSGITVQACGDAHLSNFGMFASPERRLVFDINDFDETLPGPFEFDVKRMTASFTIAARNNGFSKSDTKAATLEAARSYRLAMVAFAQMRTMEVWYAHLGEDELRATLRAAGAKDKGSNKKAAKGGKKTNQKLVKLAQKQAEKIQDKARTRDSLQALGKLGEIVDGQYRIVSQPPIVVPARDLTATDGFAPADVEQVIDEQFRRYRSTLQDDRRHLLERFDIVDVARKVVGVGSVGTRAYIVLLQGRDAKDRCSCRSRKPPGRCSRPICQQQVPPTRPARGARSTDDAGRQRHLPRLEQGRRRDAPLLLAPAARHERRGGG
jgi:uncharacterized protein (DUF2252 family)